VRRKLIGHVFPAFVGITCVALAAMAWSAARAARSLQIEWTERELTSVARLVARDFEGPWALADAPGLDEMCKALGRSSGYRITVIRSDGRVAGDSEAQPAEMENHGDRPEVLQALKGQTGMSIRYSRTVRRDLMYVAVPLVGSPAAGAEACLRVSVPLREVEGLLNRLWPKLLWSGALIIAASALVSIVVARRFARPLLDLCEGAERFAVGKLDRRLGASRIVEVNAVAVAMNRMAAQWQDRIDTVTRQRDEQEALLGCMTEAVVAVDPGRRLIELNRAAVDVFGVEDAGWRGRELLEVIRNPDLDRLVQLILTDGVTVEAPVDLPASDRYLQARGTLLRGPAGTGAGAVIVLADVTRLRKMEALQRDFVANASHELKTPVTSIRGFADTLLDGAGEDPETRARFLKIIQRQSERLQSIIEDMLMLSKLEHGTEADAEPLGAEPLKPIIEAAVRDHHPAADAKRIAVEVACAPDLCVKADAHLLEQAVGNLIDNAVKYSGEGTLVRIACEAQGDKVAICVIDKGPGIPATHLPHLFERFYRVDKSRSRKLGGTGLGLAIVKHITLVHGGRAEVASRVGEGSTFTLTLRRCSPEGASD
jgi:two-component system phosphate regulon sensor histidine kinase PhoR